MKDFKGLQPGDRVQNTGSSRSYMVTANYGDRCTAVHTVDMTNPSEWVVSYSPRTPLERGVERVTVQSLNIGGYIQHLQNCASRNHGGYDCNCGLSEWFKE